MDNDISVLIDQLRGLEAEIEKRLGKRREALKYQFNSRKVVFERSILEEHRKLRAGIITYLRSSPILSILTAPVIYGMVIPFAILDICVCVYQWVCFTAWGIPLVSRSEYIVIDRHRLAYLNGIQKLNCAYCSYGNGLIAFVREIGSRTEAYWCPIRHALRVPSTHDRYRSFLAYGDAAGFVAKSEEYRRNLRELSASPPREGDDS